MWCLVLVCGSKKIWHSTRSVYDLFIYYFLHLLLTFPNCSKPSQAKYSTVKHTIKELMNVEKKTAECSTEPAFVNLS